MIRRKHLGPVALIAAVIVAGGALALWKNASLAEAAAAAANQAEPIESVAVAVAQQTNHYRATTAIGTIVATRSITVRNELPGTVRRVALQPGRIVEPGEVLVALDVSVEEADLRALEAQAKLAETQYERIQRMNRQRAASDMEVDTARAERDVALAQIERVKAVIDRKTIRAPFRARIGISDVHPGQYLNEGTLLTTLQGVDEAAYVDFSVAQHVATQLRDGDSVRVHTEQEGGVVEAKIVAVDARVDPATRNAMVRAAIRAPEFVARPGASVRVEVPTETPRLAVTIPANAVRKGPDGDSVFVIETTEDGQTRARVRPVKVEAARGDSVVIADGLAAGERVAASGSFKLRDSVLVAISNAQEVVAGTAPALATDRG
jgi:membrane fusion protein (multidrug efflux system)